MLVEKQKIVSALDTMAENEIQSLWEIIQRTYLKRSTIQCWDDISTDTPTKEEKIILDSIDENDENFISQSELLERLGLTVSDLQ